MAHDIVWQYSEEWQRLNGVFAGEDGVTRDDAMAAFQPALWEDDELLPASGFVPAVDKLEAVNRLSHIAGGPSESLGPGSKERKSVLVTVRQALGLEPSLDRLPKPELGEAIAGALGVGWDDACWSSGATITLIGLNRLLEGATSRFGGVARQTGFASAEEEARAILDTVAAAIPRHFDGKSAIEEMLRAESRNWAQSEWPGFFFEHRGITACISALGGEPVASPGRTKFDYGLQRTWDFKCHAAADPWAILNDQDAIRWALSSGGLGFIVLEGDAAFDPAFDAWQRTFKEQHGVRPRPRAAEAGYVRKLKASFATNRLTAFWFEDETSWAEAISAGVVRDYNQGQQVSGAHRRAKYQMHVRDAQSWIVGVHELTR